MERDSPLGGVFVEREMQKIVIVWSGPEDGTSANLFKALGRAAGVSNEIRYSPNMVMEGGIFKKVFANLRNNFGRIPDIIWSDGIVVHSYAALSIVSIILARLFRRKVIVFNWDVYPITISGKRRSGSLPRRMFDYLENIAIKLATRIVVPSEDFRGHVSHKNLTVVPLWPSIPIIDVDIQAPIDHAIKIAFVGQIDVTRGLGDAFQFILAACKSDPVEFHIFSSGQRLPDSEAKVLEQIPGWSATYYPFTPRDQLVKKMREMHFGLISLHRGLDQPGYPSKSFDYIAGNLPILYFGRELRDYCGIIEKYQVGSVLRSGCDLRQLYKSLKQDWDKKRDAFLGHTQLTPEKIEDITA